MNPDNVTIIDGVYWLMDDDGKLIRQLTDEEIVEYVWGED